MEAKELELTVEDITLMYRGWITKLFLADEKTEKEIVELLYERRLLVTVAKIRKCLQDWDLIPPSSPPVNLEPEEETDSNLDGSWEMIRRQVSMSPNLGLPSESSTHPPLVVDPELVPSLPPVLLSPPGPSQPEQTPTATATEPDPEVVDLYKKRPLPSIPLPNQNKRKACDTSLIRDKLKLTCHHGLESHEVETVLDSLFLQGPSPIETYASDDQAHERFAIGLIRSRRSGEALEGGVRERPWQKCPPRMKSKRKMAKQN